MGTGMISVNNVIVFSCFIAFSAVSYECARDNYSVFYKSEQSNEGGSYYNEISYRLINELKSRCLYEVVNKSTLPRFIGSEKRVGAN